MKKIILLATLLFFLFILPGKAFAVCNNPPSGSWVVNGEEHCENQTITLNGNLTINPTGNLTLKNVTLILNCSFNGEFKIVNNGTLLINSSTITSGNTSGFANYGFINNPGSNLTVSDSHFRYFGYYSDDITTRGIVVQANNILIKNNVFMMDAKSDNVYGLILKDTSNATIDNNTINSTVNYRYRKAVVIINSENCNITNNKIYMTTSIGNTYNRGISLGLWPYEGSKNILIKNNLINMSGQESKGIFVRPTSINNVVTNNTIELYADSSYGMRLSDSVTATNNTIIAHGPRSYGIFFYRCSNAANISNNTINVEKGPAIEFSGDSLTYFIHNITSNYAWGKPILYFLNSPNSTLNNCEFSQLIVVNSSNFTVQNCTTHNHGVKVIFSPNFTLNSSNLTVRGRENAVYIYNSSESVIVNSTLHTLFCSGNNYAHSIFVKYSNRTTIENNTIVNDDGSSDAIHIEHSSYNTLANIEINTTSSYSRGLYLYYSSFNNITNLTIYTKGNKGHCIYLSNADANAFSNVAVLAVGWDNTYGLYSKDSKVNKFNDSIIYSFWNSDVYLDGFGNITMTNVTFNTSDITFATGSTANITVKWYVDVRVENSLGSPVQGANITCEDRYGKGKFSELSDENGSIRRKALTEFWKTASQTYYYTNYTFTATKDNSDYGITRMSVNINETQTIVITLTKPPKVYEPKTYTYANIEKTVFKSGRPVIIRVNITDFDGRDDIKSATVTITDSLGEVRVSEGSMNKTTSITNGYTYEYIYTLPNNASGVWTINVTGEDKNGNKGSNKTTFASLSLTLQVKLVLNNSEASIYVPGYGEVSKNNQTYTNPKYYYIVSYMQNILTGLLLKSNNPVSLFTDTQDTNYAIAIDTQMPNSMIFVIFSEGNWVTVNRRISLINRGEFLKYPKPTFAFGLGTYEVDFVIPLGNVSGRAILHKGEHKISIKHGGVTQGKVLIEITPK
ncbi:MAG: right-handed parallel beta-helix repeat-containing protein [Candidatus Aenigmarchaeota archaeon]|nr:right-handed parallel beta-helix repeat-containing protein [Candidatus Aenigmarchaeota archaeon]